MQDLNTENSKTLLKLKTCINGNHFIVNGFQNLLCSKWQFLPDLYRFVLIPIRFSIGFDNFFFAKMYMEMQRNKNS